MRSEAQKIMTQMDKNAAINAEKWLNTSIDEQAKQEIISLRENNVNEFIGKYL